MTTPASASWLFELFELREPETQVLEERMPERRVQDRRKTGNGSQDRFNGTRLHRPSSVSTILPQTAHALGAFGGFVAFIKRFVRRRWFCRIVQKNIALARATSRNRHMGMRSFGPVVMGESQACRHAVLTANYARQ